MLRNYLKIAVRNLFKEKLYSSINLVGLSVGMAVAVLIMLYVREEWSFDQFHSKSDRIYRTWVKEHYEGELFFNTSTPFILGRELEANFPEVEAVARYFPINELVKNGEFSDQENIHLVSPDFLHVFDFELLHGGDSKTVIADLNSVVLTPEVARKYFGYDAPIGEALSIQVSGAWQEFQVAGIVEKAPSNSSIQYDMMIAFGHVKNLASERARNSWTNVNPETYVLLQEGAEIEALDAKVKPYIDQQVAKLYEPGEYIVGFQPLADIHLNNDIPLGYAAVSDGRYPYILSAIALLILLLAAINFVTLSVGRSVSRAKEVGVRKVSGATRLQLMQQFWSEAIVLSFLAMGLGLLITELLLPIFNELADKQLVFQYSWQNIGFLAGLVLFLGLASGIYPALVISGFSPINALKDMVNRLGTGKHLVLRSLVGAQFVLSIGLIVCTFIMQGQMRFLQQKNLGYDKEQMLVLPYSATPTMEKGFVDIYEEGLQKAELLQQELRDNSNVLGLATSTHTFGTPGWMQLGYTDPASQKFRQFFFNAVDYNYIPTLGVELVDGRNFSEAIGTDATSAVIMNETMAQLYGLENGIGQQLPKPFEQFELIGIAKDFNFASLHTEVEPLIMGIAPTGVMEFCSDLSYNDTPTPKMTIKIAGNDVQRTIKSIQEAWKTVAPDQPFDFTFVDQALDNQYRAEDRLSQILTLATMLAIFIACLGLFGIATLTTARRIKEIGIRKVLGASAFDIVVLLNKNFAWMVLAASLIAAPLSYYFMQEWLTDFAYQISINPLIFVLATVLALVVAWLAVSYHSLRAALSNPVKALKYE